jgi:hypothetical protein
MTTNEKEMLLALIKGLTTTQNGNQYDRGKKVIVEKNINILVETIKNL